MQFRVLGSFEVVRDGQAVSLSAGAELSVLALLVLNAGRVVPAEALIDASWAERPPVNPANALQLRVSKLRRALEAVGLPAAAVVTRRPGYLLDVEPDQVDAHRFVRLVGSARRLAVEDAAQAVAVYAEALALWRGPALPEFASQVWAVPEVVRLTELRTLAIEERIELGLATGRHSDLVGELEALVALHPLRERMHGQLMRALYRSGRQADALAAYRRARQLLADELGLEPSPELRELEQAILRQESALAPPQEYPPQPATLLVKPVGLPARLSSFVGRAQELALVRDLAVTRRLVTLTGPGGVGKTSLALEAARTVDGFPDGVWFVRLAGTTDESRVPEVVAEAVGLPPGAAPETAGRLAGHLRGRSALVLLDNCEHLAEACARLAERLLESCPRLGLLATSREPLGTPGEVQLAVAPLDVPPDDAAPADLPVYDAVRLFLDRAATARPDFRLDATTAPAVLHICQQLDGLPLAVELAAARVKSLPVAELANRLRDRFAVLTAGSRTADRRQQTLRATVQWSHRLLSEPEKVLFRRLALFRGGWTLAAAEDVGAGQGLDRADVLDVLARLVDRSLVVADHGADARFHMLETLRQYAMERLTEAGEVATVAAAHARHYTAAAERGERLLRGPDQGRQLRWLHRERDNLEAALAWCRDPASGAAELGLRLVAALGWFWYMASRADGGRQVADMLAGAPDVPDAARARALLAQSVAGRPGACIVHPHAACASAARDSVVMFEHLGDRQGIAYARALLAVEGVAADEQAESMALLDSAEAWFRTSDDQWGQALALFVRMELHFAAGAPNDANECASRALALFRRLDDHWGVSAVQYHRGLALHRGGEWAAARSAYQDALAEGHRVGFANTVQHALGHLGHVALATGDVEHAERSFAEAHAAAGQLGLDGNPVAALGEALLARRRGDWATAADRYHVALDLARERPDWTAVALSGLGRVAEHGGDLAAARSWHEQAWRVAREARAFGPTAAALEGLAAVAAAAGEAAVAAALLGSANRCRVDRHVPPTPDEQADIERAARTARDLLGDELYAATYAAAPVDPEELIDRMPSP